MNLRNVIGGIVERFGPRATIGRQPDSESARVEEVEAHYSRSTAIKEICVLGLGEPGGAAADGPFAVVVPDMERLAARRVVNIGDLLRFEIEGLSAGLPLHERVRGYDICFEPLPRTGAGELNRHEIERKVRARGDVAEGAAMSEADLAWANDAHVRAGLPLVAAHVRPGSVLLPDRNLEIDLGLDSIARVGLLAALEQRFGASVGREREHEILTLRQLLEAVRPAGGNTPVASRAESPWTVLLRDLPSADDPVLSGLLESRPLLTRLLHAAVRVLTLLLFRLEVSGLEHLPASGAWIVSPNHQSYVDPFILCGALPYRVFRQLFFVGATEYFETPATAWFARLVNCVPVDPDAHLVPAMKAGAFGLAHGKVLLLFPEGERSIDGSVKHFKKGAPVLACHLGVPIVPVAIAGTFGLWPRGGGFRWSRLRPWSGHRVRICFGRPLHVGETTTYEDAAAALRAEVVRMWKGGTSDAPEPSTSLPRPAPGPSKR